MNDWRPSVCDYYLGEVFLLGMYTTIGADGVSAALRDLQAQTILYGSTASEDLIYQAFEKHTPPGRMDAFRARLPAISRRINHRAAAGIPEPASMLIALYDAAHGVDWTSNANWLSDAPLGAWHGVVTDVGERVTGLMMKDNHLIGEIPSELGGLTNLKELNLSFNRLTGEIPSELGSLANLKELNFQSNDLTGEVPSELGNLINLEELALGDNGLTGEIPYALAGLTSLRRLYLYGNQLVGEIPPELARLANLLGLHLSPNPPKDTDGRREDSGRGWVRELQGRWPGVLG